MGFSGKRAGITETGASWPASAALLITAEERWQQYEVAYREAARALDEQLKVFDGVQTRTGTLIAAAAIVTSFLGGQALTSGGPAGWTWIALAAFAGLLVVPLLVLRHPKPVTAASPSLLIPTSVIELA
jgi:hypothetical protein